MITTFRKEQAEPNDLSKMRTKSVAVELPVEVWEQIIAEAWKAPMTIPDRIHFKSAVEKASPVFRDILSRVALQDVYVPWPNHLASWDDSQANTWPTPSQSIHRLDLVRSLSRQITLANRPLDALQHRMSQLHNIRGRPIRDILSTFRGLPFLPNLQRVCIQYHPPHSSEQLHGLSSPYHRFNVVRLTVEITKITPWLWDMIRSTSSPPEDDFLLVRRPHVEFMSTVSEEAVSDILHMCPHLELAEDAQPVDLRILESSRKLNDDCTLIHGPIHCYEVWDVNPTDEATSTPNTQSMLTVRGACLALIVPSHRKPTLHATEDNRKTHIFVRRRS